MDFKGGVLCQKVQLESWLQTVDLGLSRQRMKQTSSSIVTILKECNLVALEKGRKWNLRRVRDMVIAPQRLRCDLPKLKHPMMVEMTKAKMIKAEVRTRSRHRTTHVQELITLNP